jgi:hypothetical protein
MLKIGKINYINPKKMQKEQIIQKIEESIKNREELSPFLFT